MLAAITRYVGPELHQRQATRLDRPAAVEGLHVPHRRRFKAGGQRSPLAGVAPDRLMLPAPVEQQRFSRSGDCDRALTRTEARGIQQGREGCRTARVRQLWAFWIVLVA
jgi:hypothetical protein